MAEALIPLESNPEVLNKYLEKLGVSSNWSIVDVMGLEPEMLSWVPRPVAAVMFLFPLSDAYEQHRLKEENDISLKGQEVTPKIFFVKQNRSNACGTIALVHSVANNTDKIELSADGYLKKFLDEAQGLDYVAKGELLDKNDGIINSHKELSQEGQTNAPDEPVNHHFITFAHVDGSLYELDGRRSFPVNHGPTTPDTLLEDAAKICKKFMERDPTEVRFTVIALAAKD